MFNLPRVELESLEIFGEFLCSHGGGNWSFEICLLCSGAKDGKKEVLGVEEAGWKS
jgi:hypothetical protein